MAKDPADRQSCVSSDPHGIDECPSPSTEDERTPARRTSAPPASEPAYHHLVTSNLGFVVKIANEYRNMGVPVEDLLNEGNIGLIEAARHFDPDRGARFIAYAIWWVRKSILRALSEHAPLVRIPNYQMKKMRAVRETGRMLQRALGREADREEISKEMRVTIAQIDAILQTKARELSLDDKVGHDTETPLSDFLVDHRSVNPEHELIEHESKGLVRQAMQELSDLERMIIVSRFGLEGDPVLTLQEIGAGLGLSRERVRQIESRAKSRLRRVIARHERSASTARAAASRRGLPRPPVPHLGAPRPAVPRPPMVCRAGSAGT